MKTYPVYFLKFKRDWRIILSSKDVTHIVLWENVASHIVAEHYGIYQKRIKDLPYSQRRGRMAGNKIYYGEQFNAQLLQEIRSNINNDMYFVYDDHEKRLKEEVREFRRIISSTKIDNYIG